jgi:hypothetical protein
MGHGSRDRGCYTKEEVVGFGYFEAKMSVQVGLLHKEMHTLVSIRDGDYFM